MEQDKSPKEMEKHKKDVRRKRASQHYSFMIASASIFGLGVSLAMTIVGLSNKQELPKQITEVENAIRNLRNLETYLEKIKSDMIATEQAKVRIEEEYNKVKELEKLTKNQLDAISLAVNKRTKAEIVKSYFWGFVLGVSGSLVASYIFGYLKRKKAEMRIGKKVEQLDT